MPSPDIPELDFGVEPNGKNAANFLLLSVALMEVSLAKLVEAVAEEMLHYKEGNSHIETAVQGFVDVNRSVTHILNEISMLQILLQIMLEMILDTFTIPVDGCTSEMSIVTGTNTAVAANITTLFAAAVSTAASTDTIEAEKPDLCSSVITPSTAMCDTPNTMTLINTLNVEETHSIGIPTAEANINTASLTAAEQELDAFDTVTEPASGTNATNGTIACIIDKCHLEGNGIGSTTNLQDAFYNGISVVQTYININCKGSKDNFLYYSVQKGNAMKSFTALSKGMTGKYHITGDVKMAVFQGRGFVIQKEFNDLEVTDACNFVMTVWYERKDSCLNSFEISISADNCNELSHNSGKVETGKHSLVIY